MQLHREDFEIIKVIGRGAFGEVRLINFLLILPRPSRRQVLLAGVCRTLGIDPGMGHCRCLVESSSWWVEPAGDD